MNTEITVNPVINETIAKAQRVVASHQPQPGDPGAVMLTRDQVQQIAIHLEARGRLLIFQEAEAQAEGRIILSQECLNQASQIGTLVKSLKEWVSFKELDSKKVQVPRDL